MSRVHPARALVFAAGAAVALLALAAGGEAPLAKSSNSTISLLAIDASPQGNSATFLGPIDGCARVEQGSEISIDYVADSIPQDRPMIGFEAQIRYDPQLLQVLALDYDYLLAAVGTYSPFAGLSDALPDSDGDFRISVLDTASAAEPEANVESGAGVLARITFRAKAVGVSDLAIAVQKEPLIYPLIQDTQNEMIFVDRLGSAAVAVGQDCPAEAIEPKIEDLRPMNEEILASNPDLRASVTPGGGTTSPSSATTNGNQTPARGPVTNASPSPAPASKAGDDNSDAWLIGGILILSILGAAAGGGWYLYRRSRNSPLA